MIPEVEALFARYGSAYRWLAVVAVMSGTISMVLTTTIVNVAMPDIQGAFGMSQDQVQWLSTGFLAAMTATMLVNAWAVESFGQRNTYMGALVIFIAASVMGGLSPNSSILVLARVLQGAMAGIIQPLAMLTIFQVFPAEQRGKGMGIYGIGVVLAPAVGPSLGGVVVDNFDWRAVFYMALPTCVLGLLMAPAFMIGRTRQGPRPSFDWTGFVLLSIFLITFLGGLSNGQRWGWHDSGVYLLLFIGLLSGVGFVWWESRTRRPMQDLRIFLNPGFGAASLVAMVLGAGIYGSTYLVPLFVQGIQGYSPTESGLVLMPAGVILALVFPLAGQITDRVRPHVPIILGLTLFSFSSYQLAKSDIHTSFALLATWIMVGRIGMGFILPALNAGAVRCLPMEQIAQGSGGVNFARQFGGALGVNLLSIMLDRRTFFHSDHFAQTQTAANEMTRELLRQVVSILDRSGVPAAWQQAGAVGYLGRVITQQARTAGFQDGFLIVAAVFMLAVIPAWVMGRYARR